MKILFLGSGEIAIPTFQALLTSPHEVIGIVTQPDKPVGRKKILTGPPIKAIARQAEIEVFQPEKLRDSDAVAKLKSWAPDIAIVMAYGQILSQEVIDIPTLGTINLHASLLPKYRGASCIPAAILAGDKSTGITCMHVIKKLDAGDIISQAEIPIEPGDTGGSLHDKLSILAAELILPTLDKLEAGIAQRIPQDEAQSTYAPKLSRLDGKIDWNLSADKILRQIRAYAPWPGTWSEFQDNQGKLKTIKIFPPANIVYLGEYCPCDANSILANSPAGTILPHPTNENELLIRCGLHAICIRQVQPDGSKPQSVDEFLRGQRNCTSFC